jgi:hypothetical protein
MVTQINAVHHTGDFRAQEMQEKAVLYVAVCINLYSSVVPVLSGQQINISATSPALQHITQQFKFF